MEIISSQPFLIVFYRKVLPLFPFREKNSFPPSLPCQKRPIPMKGKQLFRIFYFLA